MGERSVFIDEAAALLGVSRRTVYYRIRQGRLQTIRTRCGTQRVLLSSIEDLLRDMARASRPLEPEALPFEVEPLA
jgi:excisionase family DNA binding protein